MLRTSVPLCVVAIFVMIGVAGCEKKSRGAVVIGKDYVAVVEAGEEIKDERATNHQQRIVKARMLMMAVESKSALIKRNGRNCAKTIGSSSTTA